jgi:hypothetical protein
MQMNRVALMASAGFGLAFLAACSDSPTAPSNAAFVPKSTFAVGDVTTSTPELGKVKVCKAGNIGGSFDVTRNVVGGSTGTVSGLNTLIANGQCKIVAEDQSGSGVGSEVIISEDAAANVVSSVTGCVFIGNPGGIDAAPCAFNPTSRFINQFHGYVITYTNTFTPPPPPSTGCTFTKGWYRNNGSNTIIAVDGRTIGQEQQIFDATPGKPGNVTWGANNNNLNLYQQLLAALNNLGGNATAGPAAVDAAVAAALAATSGSGTTIVVAPGTDVSGLIDVLSAFNEGTFTGWPHCD